MKIFLSAIAVVVGISAYTDTAVSSKWPEKDCGGIEQGVGGYIGVSEHFRKAAEAAEAKGDMGKKDEHWLAAGFTLQLAANWATIYDTFCKK